jgi:hypothetical protein
MTTMATSIRRNPDAALQWIPPMFFASPIWLALLLPPWAAVAVWLMWSRRGERTDVPFLALWRGGAAESPREKREFRPPPIPLVAALAAALLAIVASARPGVGWGSRRNAAHITIVLDRGLTMSVGERRAEVTDAAAAALRATFDWRPPDFVPVPDGYVDRSDHRDWLGPVRDLPPTQDQTGDAVRVAVQRALAKTGGPVIVLSDQAIADDPRVVQIAPTKPIANVAITNFVIRETPTPQAMIAVANASPLERATLRVRSGDRNVERTIDLPRAAGGAAKVFVDFPALDAAAVAEIDVADDIAIDNVAHAKRQRSFPAIEIRAAVPAEVRRVVDAYAKARPAQDAGARVAIVRDDAIPTDSPVAILSRSSAGGGGAGGVTVAAHPVSAGVDWADAKPQAAGVPPPAPSAPGQGWRAVVSVGDRPAVAVRETPHRQVWIGFDAPDFARQPEFVIFWTNVFDWLAGGAEDAGGAIADASKHWSSSVVPPIKIPPPPATDWRAKMAALATSHRRRRDVTSAVLLLSVICLIVAAVAWPGRSLTPISAPRTV